MKSISSSLRHCRALPPPTPCAPHLALTDPLPSLARNITTRRKNGSHLQLDLDYPVSTPLLLQLATPCPPLCLLCPFASLTRCARRQVLPLVVALVVLSIIGFVLYQVYLSATKFRESASERMGKKNVVFTKDGVRVGVKQIQNEKYVDTTQSWVVKAWNLGNSKDDEL